MCVLGEDEVEGEERRACVMVRAYASMHERVCVHKGLLPSLCFRTVSGHRAWLPIALLVMRACMRARTSFQSVFTQFSCVHSVFNMHVCVRGDHQVELRKRAPCMRYTACM